MARYVSVFLGVLLIGSFGYAEESFPGYEKVEEIKEALPNKISFLPLDILNETYSFDYERIIGPGYFSLSASISFVNASKENVEIDGKYWGIKPRFYPSGLGKYFFLEFGAYDLSVEMKIVDDPEFGGFSGEVDGLIVSALAGWKLQVEHLNLEIGSGYAAFSQKIILKDKDNNERTYEGLPFVGFIVMISLGAAF